jgi:hypothetical protein
MSLNCQPPATATPTERQAHADQWFPAPSLEVLAKTLCNGCEQLAECRQYALTHHTARDGHVEGVWGGTTTEERANMRKGRPGVAA